MTIIFSMEGRRGWVLQEEHTLNTEMCKITKRPLRMWMLLSFISIILSMLGLFIVISLAQSKYVLPYTLFILFILCFYILLLYKEGKEKNKILKKICEFCDTDLIYSPRRFTYACRSAGWNLCYSSVEEKIYFIKINKKIDERKISPWSSLDFYCIKPVELEDMEGDNCLTWTRGLFYFYDPIKFILYKSWGVIVWVNQDKLSSECIRRIKRELIGGKALNGR